MTLRASTMAVLTLMTALTPAGRAFAQPAATPQEAPAPPRPERTPQAPPAASPQPTPPPSAVPEPTPGELRARRVRVDIDSTKPSTVIERRISVAEKTGAFFFLPFRSTESVWEQVCVTPCTVDLDRFSTYRVGSVNGIVSTHPFTLPQGNDPFHLRIEPGSAIANRVGVTLTAVGLAATIVGVALIAGQKLFGNPPDARNAGFITGGSGIVLLALGIPITVLTKTKVLGPTSRVALTPRGIVF